MHSRARLPCLPACHTKRPIATVVAAATTTKEVQSNTGGSNSGSGTIVAKDLLSTSSENNVFNKMELLLAVLTFRPPDFGRMSARMWVVVCAASLGDAVHAQYLNKLECKPDFVARLDASARLGIEKVARCRAERNIRAANHKTSASRDWTRSNGRKQNRDPGGGELIIVKLKAREATIVEILERSQLQQAACGI
jgi:hypothetical protein